MGVRFIGVKTVRPLALCKQGANPHAHVLMTKTRKTAPNQTPVPEKTDMNIGKIAKALLAMDAITKAYFEGLDDDKATAFLEKSADEQKAEAAAAKAAADEAAARAAGKSARELELESQIGSLQGTVKTLQEQNEARDIEKRAATEFAGYPGGVAEATKKLQSCKGLSPELREVVESGMRDKIAALKLTTRTIGHGAPVSAETMPATKKLSDAADKLASEKGITKQQAMYQMSEDAAYAQDFATARQEQEDARAAA